MRCSLPAPLPFYGSQQCNERIREILLRQIGSHDPSLARGEQVFVVVSQLIENAQFLTDLREAVGEPFVPSGNEGPQPCRIAEQCAGLAACDFEVRKVLVGAISPLSPADVSTLT